MERKKGGNHPVNTGKNAHIHEEKTPFHSKIEVIKVTLLRLLQMPLTGFDEPHLSPPRQHSKPGISLWNAEPESMHRTEAELRMNLSASLSTICTAKASDHKKAKLLVDAIPLSIE